MWKLTRKTGFCLTFLVTLGAIIVGTNGKPPSRIRGGSNAALNEGTFVVRLTLVGPEATSECTGAIVGRRHILTAGHCVENKNSGTVIGGTHDRSDNNPILSTIAKLYKHPQYSIRAPYDVGIVEVDSDLDLSGRQTSVPLTTSDIDFSSRGLAFGWSKCGYDGIEALQKLNVRFLTKEDCNNRGGYDEYPQLLCVDTGYSDFCGGDSGGPIVSGERVVGIATNRADNVGEPATAQNVYHYLSWINSIVNNNYTINNTTSLP